MSHLKLIMYTVFKVWIDPRIIRWNKNFSIWLLYCHFIFLLHWGLIGRSPVDVIQVTHGMASRKWDSSSIHLFCEHVFDSRRDHAVTLRDWYQVGTCFQAGGTDFSAKLKKFDFYILIWILKDRLWMESLLTIALSIECFVAWFWTYIAIM